MNAARRVLTGLALVATVGAAAVTATRWVDDARTAYLPALQALVPAAGLATAVLLVMLLLLRRWRFATAAAVVAAVHVVLAVPMVTASPSEPGHGDVVVMSANLYFGQASAAAVVHAVDSHDVDVLVLPEATPSGIQGLDDAGLAGLLPHASGVAEPGASGTIVRSRFPLQQKGSVRGEFEQPVVEVATESGGMTLVAAHPYPPTGPDRWRDDLRSLTRWRAEAPAGRPLVMAGDFNAGADHPAFRDLAETMTDAHDAAGSGWAPTWPQGSWLPPFTQLDHVLVRDVEVVDAGTVRLPGTDHAAVWARLSP